MAIKTLRNSDLKLLYSQMHNCKLCKELSSMKENQYNGWEYGPLKGGGNSKNCKILFYFSYRRDLITQFKRAIFRIAKEVRLVG